MQTQPQVIEQDNRQYLVDPRELPQHYIAGGVYVKELILLKKGDAVMGHRHAFDHLSLVARGTVQVTVEGQPPLIFTAPTAVNVKAGLQHHVEALTDNCLWYCVHAIPADLRDSESIDAVLVGHPVSE